MIQIYMSTDETEITLSYKEVVTRVNDNPTISEAVKNLAQVIFNSQPNSEKLEELDREIAVLEKEKIRLDSALGAKQTLQRELRG